MLRMYTVVSSILDENRNIIESKNKNQIEIDGEQENK